MGAVVIEWSWYSCAPLTFEDESHFGFYCIVKTDFYTLSRLSQKTKGEGPQFSRLNIFPLAEIETFANLASFPGSRERNRARSLGTRLDIVLCPSRIARIFAGVAKFSLPLPYDHKFFTGFVRIPVMLIGFG